MSDPQIIKDAGEAISQAIVCQPQQIQWFSQLIGATLAIFGGSTAVVVRLRLEKKQEIAYIKITFVDEIQEIYTIIDKMCETHKTTNTVPMTYINDISENTKSFETNKQRLFLIGDQSLRKRIYDFYKKLNNEIKKAVETVGSLKEGDAQTAAVISTFNGIQTEAKALEKAIKDYKYKAFWCF